MQEKEARQQSYEELMTLYRLYNIVLEFNYNTKK